MDGTALAWSFSALLTLLLIGGCLFHWLKMRQQSTQSVIREEEILRRGELIDKQAEQRESDRRAHALDLEDLRKNHRREVDEGLRAYELLAADFADYRKQYAKNIGWDLRSRAKLVTMLSDMQFDGMLITNLTFVEEDSDSNAPVVVQVDHIILSERGAVLVENKGWKGLVYDGTRPSEDFGPFSTLIDETDLTGSFALHLRSETTPPPGRDHSPLGGGQPSPRTAGSAAGPTTPRFVCCQGALCAVVRDLCLLLPRRLNCPYSRQGRFRTEYHTDHC